MRGIVELEVLKAIEMDLPRNIPIRRFFDLIVGTRFVHRMSHLRLTETRKRSLLVPADVLILDTVQHDFSFITRGLTPLL